MEQFDRFPKASNGRHQPPRGVMLSPKVENTLTSIAEGIVSKKYDTVLPPQDVLAATLGVSRTVLREALTILIARGMIEARPKVGTCVRPSDEWCVVNEDVVRWRSLMAGNQYSIIREGDVHGLYARRADGGEIKKLASLSGATPQTLELIAVALEALSPAFNGDSSDPASGSGADNG